MKYALARNLTPVENETLKMYPEFLRGLLVERGLKTPEEAEKFFTPNFEADSHDPFLLKDMDRAVARILLAIEKNQKTIIFSDYDADGIPGGVILHDFFRRLGYLNFENYIPHRHLEGFGLNHEALEDFVTEKADLVITVDCGITDLEEIERGQKAGLDFIITDHHLPGEKLPEAIVLDPKRTDCDYPEKMLCGAGVAFKLVQAILLKKDFGLKPGWEKWLLDLVGIATLSDMVPLLGENRVLAYYGLKVLRKSPRLGLRSLLSILNIDQSKLTEDDIGFSLSPRINAASRLGVPKDAFDLLAATDEVEAKTLARHLNEINDERKGLVASLVKEVRKIIKKRTDDGETKKKVLVIGNPDWRPSLLGLVANSLLDDHEGAIFLWGREGGDCLKGSCRSDGSVHLLELMKQLPAGIFLDYGGHALSGGFSLNQEKVHKLEEELLVAHDKICTTDAVLLPTVLSARLTLEEVDLKTYSQLEKLAPFGVGNPKPLFLLEKVKIKEVKVFGKEKNHLEIVVMDDKKNVSITAFFTRPDFAGFELVKGEKFSFIVNLEKNNFRGKSEIRLRLVDIFVDF